VDNVKSSDVLFSVNDDTGTTHVASPSNHDNIACIELDKVGDFVLLEVKLDRVVYMDQRIGITDRATIMSDNMRNPTVADSNTANFEEFIFCFLGCDTMDGETTLDVVKKTEVFA